MGTINTKPTFEPAAAGAREPGTSTDEPGLRERKARGGGAGGVGVLRSYVVQADISRGASSLELGHRRKHTATPGYRIPSSIFQWPAKPANCAASCRSSKLMSVNVFVWRHS